MTGQSANYCMLGRFRNSSRVAADTLKRSGFPKLGSARNYSGSRSAAQSRLIRGSAFLNSTLAEAMGSQPAPEELSARSPFRRHSPMWQHSSTSGRRRPCCRYTRFLNRLQD